MNDTTIRKSLSELLSGRNAHLDLKDAVKGLKPELRNIKPAEDIHSVWELVEHIRIGQNDIVEYIFNPEWKSPKWPEEYWPGNKGMISDNDWKESLKKIDEDTAALSALINDEKIDLSAVIPHTDSHTYLREILLTADHNSYHTAQIVLVRKLLNNW